MSRHHPVRAPRHSNWRSRARENRDVHFGWIRPRSMPSMTVRAKSAHGWVQSCCVAINTQLPPSKSTRSPFFGRRVAWLRRSVLFIRGSQRARVGLESTRPDFDHIDPLTRTHCAATLTHPSTPLTAINRDGNCAVTGSAGDDQWWSTLPR